MPFKISMLFDLTTNPGDLVNASAHSAGWSEGFWSIRPISEIQTFMPDLMDKRARMLPRVASIVGLRIATYDVSGDTLIPKGAQSSKFQKPGNIAYSSDLPQCSLELSANAVGAPNSNRLTLRALPLEQINNGEYQPSGTFAAQVFDYCQQLNLQGAGFIGRVLNGLNSNVTFIAAPNIVTLKANVGGVPGNDFLRLHRVRDINNNPVKGKFLILAIGGAGNNVYTLLGVNTNMQIPSGSARVDQLAFFQMAVPQPSRAVVRKVGRPFEQYRGRRSHARV